MYQPAKIFDIKTFVIPEEKVTALLIVDDHNDLDSSIFEYLNLADEFIIVNTSSKPLINEIILHKKTIVIKSSSSDYYENLSLGIKHSKNDWIFRTFPNETLTDELALEIKTKINTPVFHAVACIKVDIDFYFCDKHIKNLLKTPRKKIRLFHKSKSILNNTVHGIKIEPKPGFLIEKTTLCLKHTLASDYTKYMFNLMKIENKKTPTNIQNSLCLFLIFLSPTFEFIKRYFFKKGFLDGYAGFILCMSLSISKFYRYSIFLLSKHKTTIV